MHFLLTYQWNIFIVAEVLSLVLLLLFGVVRYFFNKHRLSSLFIALFILFVALEAVLAWLIYRETGEIEDFQIIITIFVLYACTFGVSDFKKLDRLMRKHIGKWRGVDLLTKKDREKMVKQKDPLYIARKYRWSSLVHLIVFVAVQVGFLMYSNNGIHEIVDYIKDLSWIGTGNIAGTPYANETLYRISMVWGIVFIADFLYSWSYTIFPAKPKE